MNPATRRLALAGIALGTFGTLAGVASITRQGVRLDWGDAPTWLGVLFAAMAGLAALRLLRTEQRRDAQAEADRRERQDEARQAQAAMVCAWYGSKQLDAHAGFSSLPPQPYQGLGVYIRNASQLPVYQVRVVFFYEPEKGPLNERGSIALSVVAPDYEPMFVETKEELRKSDTVDERGKLIYTEKRNRFLAAIEFSDAAGRRWRRDPKGQLREARPSAPITEAAT